MIEKLKEEALAALSQITTQNLPTNEKIIKVQSVLSEMKAALLRPECINEMIQVGRAA